MTNIIYDKDYPFNLLTDYFLKENSIDMTLEYELTSVPARSLLCANRFDLMAKWIYIDAREKGLEEMIACKDANRSRGIG